MKIIIYKIFCKLGLKLKQGDQKFTIVGFKKVTFINRHKNSWGDFMDRGEKINLYQLLLNNGNYTVGTYLEKKDLSIKKLRI